MVQSLVTVADVARRLGLTPSRIYQLIDRGLIKAEKIGTGRIGYVVQEDEVKRYEEELQSKNDAPPASASR